ncbi:O-antigen translocase [Camelimonas fluminis]|uniref:O-antigen translocase n=1 Tax=Camelimonas fluminis TaxID=1576911 RepID=A0ABV7UG39_9HYPH|nr:O-antigen translocase [Camelimonas fluminis]GHE76953.1 O-antigen translocase [Camelimonas fluminis]
MTEKSSYRTILRSSSIMGAASIFNILAGIVKMKAAAVLLGPAGVGLVGLFQNLVQTAATVGALGFGSVGTRQVAAAHADGDKTSVVRVRRALFWGSLALSIFSTLIFWSSSGLIATHLLHAPELDQDVAWLALAVGLTIAAGSQGALLTGMRQIGDVARVQLLSSLAGAALGILALWLWGSNGILALVLVAPLSAFLAGHLYVSRLGRVEAPKTRFGALAREWQSMARLGVAFMLSGLVTMGGHLAVRSLVQQELGAGALGQFQAAWSIGMMYLGFVLGAMGTDYYPRLAAIIKDHQSATRLVNEQTEVALLLCGPVLLAMLALAPYVIRLLYSAEFLPAVEILRWQLLGDILKVMSWPLGFVLLAAGAGKTFIVTETTGIGVFVAATWVLLPLMDISATGVSFLALYLCYLPMVWWLARRRIGFRWSAVVTRQALMLLAVAGSVAGSARISETLAMAVGLVAALLIGVYAFARLEQMAELGGSVRRLARISRRIFGNG